MRTYLMRQMGWSYAELMATPGHVIMETLGVLNAEALARKHQTEGKRHGS